MSSMLSFKMDAGRFNYRTAGIILHNNKVLLTTVAGLDFWSVPGGRVEHFESSTEALKREIKEELNLPCDIKRLLWFTENMFYLDVWGCNVHELAFYYLISLPESAAIYNMDSTSCMEQNGAQPVMHDVKWAAVEELHKINLIPKFLQQGLLELPETPQHIVFNEL